MTTSGTTSENEWNEWEQVKESDFGFRIKQNTQFISTIYSAIKINYIKIPLYIYNMEKLLVIN